MNKKNIVLTIYSILIFAMCVVVVPKNVIEYEISSQNVYHKVVIKQGYQAIWQTEYEKNITLIDYERVVFQIVALTVLFAPLYFIEKR